MPRKAKDSTGLITNDGHPLTAQESRFIELYVSGKTQAQAYIEAYDAEDTETGKKFAYQAAYRLMKKDYIISEIRYRMEQAKTESIATMQEIMEYYTGVMRGDVKDAFGLEASLSERTKCAMELAKRMAILEDRELGTEEKDNVVTLKLDWGQDSAPITQVKVKKSESEK